MVQSIFFKKKYYLEIMSSYKFIEVKANRNEAGNNLKFPG